MLASEMERRTDASSRASDAATVLANGELVLARLESHLIGWFGPDGVDALLVRALERARQQNPVLEGVKWPAPGTLRLTAMGETAATSGGLEGLEVGEVGEVSEGIVALLTAILAVIARLVGDDMMRNLLRQIWPTIPADTSSLTDSQQ